MLDGRGLSGGVMVTGPGSLLLNGSYTPCQAGADLPPPRDSTRDSRACCSTRKRETGKELETHTILQEPDGSVLLAG